MAPTLLIPPEAAKLAPEDDVALLAVIGEQVIHEFGMNLPSQPAFVKPDPDAPRKPHP